MSEDRRTAEEIIPVIQEDVVIGTERATTGTVRVRTVIHEDEHAIDEPVEITEIEVKRVPADRWTDEPIADRVACCQVALSILHSTEQTHNAALRSL